MTVKELREFIENLDDDAEIGAFWDDCEWEILGFLLPGDREYNELQSVKYIALIDCR